MTNAEVLLVNGQTVFINDVTSFEYADKARIYVILSHGKSWRFPARSIMMLKLQDED